jgi:hypothetical protein
MSKQGIGETVAIPNVGTSLPTTTQGLDMAVINSGGRKPKKYRLSITVSSGAPIPSLVGSDTTEGTVWGALGDTLNSVAGALNGGVALGVETRHFIIENLGGLKRIGVRLSAGAATATLTPINENGD